MRRILWAAILIPLLIVAAAATVIVSINLGGNVTIINTSLTANIPSFQWGTLCISCPIGNGFNNTSHILFQLTNHGSLVLTINYTYTCDTSGLSIVLGQGNGNLNKGNGLLSLSPGVPATVNATLFVVTAPTSGGHSCGVTIDGSA